MSDSTRALLREASRFISGGAVGVILYYITLYVLTDILGVWYILSAICGFILNHSVNFVIHKFWAFQNKETKETRKQAIRYACLVTTRLGINIVLLYLAVEYLHLWYLTSQIIVTALLTTANFFLARRIFANVSNHPQS